MNKQQKENVIRNYLQEKYKEGHTTDPSMYELSYIPATWGMIGDQWEFYQKPPGNFHISIYAKDENETYSVLCEFNKSHLITHESMIQPDNDQEMEQNSFMLTAEQAAEKLKTWHLERLCILVYLDDILNYSGKDLSFAINSMIQKIENNAIQDLPCEMTKQEWLDVLYSIKNDSAFHPMIIRLIQEISTDSHNVYAGHRVVCFTDHRQDPLSNAYIVFRGTHGDREWLDNARGMVQADTIQQKASLAFVTYVNQELTPKSIAVAGHSKGGNKAQYTAIASPDGLVDSCVSVDGQGFSQAFLQKYKHNIESRDYLVLIAEQRDFVNCLGFYLTSNPKCASKPTSFYRGFRGNSRKSHRFGDPLPLFHCPDALRQPNSKIVSPYGAGQIPLLFNKLLTSFLTDDSYTQSQRMKTAEYFVGYMMKNREPNDYAAQAWMNLGLEVCRLLTNGNNFAQLIENVLLFEPNVLIAFFIGSKPNSNEMEEIEDKLSFPAEPLKSLESNIQILYQLMLHSDLIFKALLKILSIFNHLYLRIFESPLTIAGEFICKVIAVIISNIKGLLKIIPFDNLIKEKTDEIIEEFDRMEHMISDLYKTYEENKNSDTPGAMLPYIDPLTGTLKS